MEEYIGVVETRKILTEQMEQVDVEENRKHVEGDEKEKLFLPGTFGKRASIKKAKEIWNGIENEEKKGNMYLVIKKYKERSTKLRECFESISKEIIKSNSNCEMVA